MTNDLPNCFPSHFIYKRIPIKGRFNVSLFYDSIVIIISTKNLLINNLHCLVDNTDAKIAMYFADIINFIKRVQKCKGRV